MTTSTEESAITRAMRESEENEPDELVTEHESQLDDLEMQTEHREWTVEGDIELVQRDGSVQTIPWSHTYIQKPLSFSGMLQFTGLIGEKLSEAMSGPEGLTIDGIVGEADGLLSAGRGVMSRADFNGLDSFVKGLAKLAQYVPSVVEDCQCIWLRIPISDRRQVKEIWSRSPEDGGLSMEDGEEMLEIFLGQNYEEVERFFVVRLPKLLKKVQKLRELKDGGSQRLKRSKPTADPIPRP